MFDSVATNNKIEISGRVSSIRKMKTMVFADIFDKGEKRQIKLSKELYSKNSFIAGDIIQTIGSSEENYKGEELIEINKIKIASKWLNKVPYSDIEKLHNSPLKNFVPQAYEKIHRVNVLRKSIRLFFDNNGFTEVQTPIVLNKYNGGNSFPVSTWYLNKKIGFNRRTMEERMQAIVGVGFNKIFQIGQTFSSNKERVNLECYSSVFTIDHGKQMVIDLLSSVVYDLCSTGLVENAFANAIIEKKWEEIDFFDGIEKLIGINRKLLFRPNKTILDKLVGMNIGVNKGDSLQSLSDKLGSAIAKEYNCPMIINNFPSWSSPLYMRKDKYMIERSMVYFSKDMRPFDMGMQENDLKIFENNLIRQKGEDDSDLKEIISAGLPQMFGLGMNIYRLFMIWGLNYGVDNYR